MDMQDPEAVPHLSKIRETTLAEVVEAASCRQKRGPGRLPGAFERSRLSVGLGFIFGEPSYHLNNVFIGWKYRVKAFFYHSIFKN